MIRRLTILFWMALLPYAAWAEGASVRTLERFSQLCSAAIDESGNIETIANSLNMSGPNGTQFAMTFGKTTLRILASTDPVQQIIITTTQYSDAREIECKSIVPTPTPRADLERLARSLKLEGDFLPMPGTANQSTGRWKRPGVAPIVVVTMMSTTPSTILVIQRIDAQAQQR